MKIKGEEEQHKGCNGHHVPQKMTVMTLSSILKEGKWGPYHSPLHVRCKQNKLVPCLKRSRNPIQVLISNNYSTPITSLSSLPGLSFPLSTSPTTTSHFLSTVSLPSHFSLSFALSSVISIPFFLSPPTPPPTHPCPEQIWATWRLC